jgi:hypothetical protein
MKRQPAPRNATVVGLTGDAEDVADHHVVMRRNVLPQLAQELVLLDAGWRIQWEFALLK